MFFGETDACGEPMKWPSLDMCGETGNRGARGKAFF